MSDTPDAPAADAPLSIDSAVELLLPKDEEAPAEAAPEPEAEDPPASPEADPSDAAETPSEEEQPEVEAAPAVEAPHFWAAEDKALFAQLSPELQTKVLSYEKNRDTATAKVIQEASEARNRLTQEASRVAQLNERLDKLIPEAEAAFASKWPENPDWVATLNQCVDAYGLDEGQKQFLLLKEQHSAELQQIAAARAAKQDAERQARQTFAAQEIERLKSLEPELVDPKQGPARVQALTSFLTEIGLRPEQIADAGALELSLAYDAMRYRQGKQAAKAALAPAKPQPVAAKPAVRPAAGQTQSSSQRSAQQIQNRFAQTRSVDDAVALLLAKKA